MTYLTESRDALAKALHAEDCRDNPGHADWTDCAANGPCGRLADALIASGTVTPVATLADDEALRFTEQDIENAHEAMAEREWQWFQWLLREKVRALSAALTARSQCCSTCDEAARRDITIPRPQILTGPEHMTVDEATAHYLRDAATRVRKHRYWGSGVTALVADLLDNAAAAVIERGERS